MNFLRRIYLPVTTGNQDNDEIKKEIRKVVRDATKDFKKIREELKKTTAYKIARATGNI